MRRHLLVTNDFPPKIGGIQNYLWELWRRLEPGATCVHTTPYRGSVAFDAAQPFPVERAPEPWLGPWPWLVPRIRSLADRHRCELILLDPALPLGAIGPSLGRPYGVILHGAEVTIPARLPAVKALMARTLDGASLVVSAGRYALTEAERCVGRTLPSVVIPPGVDADRFRPLAPSDRARVRASYGVQADEVLVATVNRLVPRKGMTTLIRAVVEADRRLGQTGPRLRLIIGGTGRQEDELRRLVAELGAPVQLTGRLTDLEVAELYGGADAMAMLCNERWGGLEQEGFGIVFLEAAAAGIPQVAGRSGGAHEAVEDGVTGLIVDRPTDVGAAAAALVELAIDPERRSKLGEAARQRAIESFDNARLAVELQEAIDRADLTVRR
ncbi:MAG: glycosyltransferase family 4 protein [Actinomycetota bacterium]